MCTAVTLKTRNGYFGRNLDLEYAFGEQITVMPRRFPLSFCCRRPLREHLAMIGTAFVPEEMPLFYDAVNEKGLAMAALNFPEFAVYRRTVDDSCVAPFEMIPFVLSQCATLKEAKSLLSAVTVAHIDYHDRLPCTPLHWLLADKTGSVAVEPQEGGLRVIDNPVGVLTNSPPFEHHMLRLAEYASLSATSPKTAFANIEIPAYTRGLGTVGLPGDLTSMSRFIKAAFVKTQSVCDGSERQSVSQVFHILDSVAHPRGCVKMPDGRFEITVYSSCCNLDTGVYYYKTYDNSDVNAVSMQAHDLNGTQCCCYDFESLPHVFRP